MAFNILCFLSEVKMDTTLRPISGMSRESSTPTKESPAATSMPTASLSEIGKITSSTAGSSLTNLLWTWEPKWLRRGLRYLRSNQTTLRAENYNRVRELLNEGDAMRGYGEAAANLGQVTVLPSTFTGGSRNLQEKVQDVMTYVRKYGRPSLFITMICSAKWPEIKRELSNGQKQRQDIITRVFNQKKIKLMNLIKTSQIFRPISAFTYSIEWQKRGLPHMHLLLWLSTPILPYEIDNLIRAEIPGDGDPELQQLVLDHTVHRPCGDANPQAQCMKDQRCSKGFPKAFTKETQMENDGYPQYRRRSPEDGGFEKPRKKKLRRYYAWWLGPANDD